MRFIYDTRRYFIGQERIIQELSIVAEEVKSGENLNMLFVAPSGHGKNFLAYLFLHYVDPEYKNSVQYIPASNGSISFAHEKRFHYIDEVHLLHPQESIYSELSSGDYTIILGTNNFDKIKDAVQTRCNQFQFASYTDKELALMLQLALERKSIFLPFQLCEEVAVYCRGTPRVVDNYAQRLSFIFKHEGIPTTATEVHELMYEHLGKEDGGYTEFDLQYLEALKLNGGTAGLETLVSLTGFPKKTIIEDIEPFLIRKGRINKTMKGRILCENH